MFCVCVCVCVCVYVFLKEKYLIFNCFFWMTFVLCFQMKALYEKRVRDLEFMHAELEQKAAKQAEEHQRAGGAGGGAGGGGGVARPSTAAGSLGAGRRR